MIAPPLALTMTPDRNPYASPAASAGPGALRRVPIDTVPAEPPFGVINVTEQAAKPPRAWRLALGRDEAWLSVPGEESAFVLTHAELAEHGNLLRWARFIAIVLRGLAPDGRAIAFKIEGEGIAMFRSWILSARQIHVEKALKKRLRFSLPIGLFVAATALPILGPRLDPFALVFGAGLAVLALVGPRFPRPSMFAVEAVLWFALGASHLMSLIGGSTWSILFLFVCLLIGRQSLRTFSFYR
jgi:hypothetical protein